MRALGGDPAASRCGAMVSEQLAAGGKRVRARLELAAIEALGGDRRDAGSCRRAAACGLLHNATLVHDDVQDGDTTRRGHRRRGRGTAWRRRSTPAT
ncbi:MAG: polyprenyl synthetase family protein [Polyangiales bacterium]